MFSVTVVDILPQDTSTPLHLAICTMKLRIICKALDWYQILKKENLFRLITENYFTGWKSAGVILPLLTAFSAYKRVAEMDC